MALTTSQLTVIDKCVGKRIEMDDSSGINGIVHLTGVIEAVDVDARGYRTIQYRTQDGELNPFGFSVEYASSRHYADSGYISISAPYIGSCRIFSD